LRLPQVALILIFGALVGAAVALIAFRDPDDTSITGGVQGSGVAEVESRNLPAFTSIDLAGTNTLTVRIAGEQSVVVSGDDNLLDRVVTTVRDDELSIANRGSFTTDAPMAVDITVPALDRIALSGTGTVTIVDVTGEKLSIDVPGSGSLTVGGRVERLDVSLGGSGNVDLRDLVAREVTASVSGTGDLHVKATGSLAASVTGVGSIFYSGAPSTLTKTITGIGTIAAE
jgi:hypothetical protein